VHTVCALHTQRCHRCNADTACCRPTRHTVRAAHHQVLHVAVPAHAAAAAAAGAVGGCCCCSCACCWLSGTATSWPPPRAPRRPCMHAHTSRVSYSGCGCARCKAWHGRLAAACCRLSSAGPRWCTAQAQAVLGQAQLLPHNCRASRRPLREPHACWCGRFGSWAVCWRDKGVEYTAARCAATAAAPLTAPHTPAPARLLRNRSAADQLRGWVGVLSVLVGGA
jgi:hypothetical protein